MWNLRFPETAIMFTGLGSHFCSFSNVQMLSRFSITFFFMLYEYDNWNHFWYFLFSLCLNLNQVKFSELTLDTFRMLQCLEWEPSGSFYQSSGAKNGQNGAPASSRINYSQDIADPTLPPNPRKAVLYRPSVTHFLAVSIMGNNLLICCLFLYSVFCYIVF